jgi:ribosomal protein S18 acetylase RimI-like enzyme
VRDNEVTKQLTIRPYRPQDEFQVLALWQACGLIVPWNNPKRDIERKLAVNPELFLVGELEGRVVATCMAGYEGHRGWINYLAVLPELRRHRIAAVMMEAAESRLRRMGCPKINLQVRASNEEVIAFYESIGYKTDSVVSMGKRLEQDGPYAGIEGSDQEV